MKVQAVALVALFMAVTISQTSAAATRFRRAGLFTTTVDTARALVDDIESQIENLINSAEETIKNFTSDALDQANNITNQFVQQVVDTATNATGNSTASDFLNCYGFTEIVDNVTQNIKDGAEKCTDQLLEPVNTTLTALQLLKDGVDTIADGIDNIVSECGIFDLLCQASEAATVIDELLKIGTQLVAESTVLSGQVLGVTEAQVSSCVLSEAESITANLVQSAVEELSTCIQNIASSTAASN